MKKFDYMHCATNKRLLLLTLLISLLMSHGCKESNVASNTCIINGVIEVSNVWTNHPNGFRISIISLSDNSLVYTAVSDDNGRFIFQDIDPGEYTIEVRKDGYEWGWMKYDGNIISSWNRKIVLKANETKDLVIYMKDIFGEDKSALDITDMDGNPINRIGISPNATTISFKIINQTQSNSNWELSSKYCFGTIHFQTIYVFTSFNRTSGSIAAGDNVVVVGYINPEVFSPEFELNNGSIDFYDGGSTTTCKSISIYFED